MFVRAGDEPLQHHLVSAMDAIERADRGHDVSHG
jgi:hypothetical protein